MDENEKTMSLAEAITAGWDAAVGEEPAAEAPVEAPVEAETAPEANAEVPAEEPAPVETPVEAPVNPVNPLESQNAQLMQMIQQQQAIIQQLTAQNQQAGQAMQQQSELAEEAVNRTMEPYPQLDWNAVRYMEGDAQNQAIAQWQQAVMERAVQDAMEKAMGEMKPIREQYEANRRMAENDAARTAVFGDPRFTDFADRRDAIEQVINNTPALQGLSPTDRYVIGGLMDRGMRHQNAPTTEEILAMARANPEVMKALAAQQATEMAQAQAGVPKIAASTGMAQAQAIPENRPKNDKELGAALLKGLMVR
ncbi:MAG: hypothetical protein IJB52_10310 [Clostridia bacterium]|nr:hypothetical protein [Clostridia bacterium]